MARDNFEAVLESGFDATVHIHLGLLADVLHNAFCEGVLPGKINQTSKDGVILHTIHLFRPTLWPIEFDGTEPSPIPTEVNVNRNEPLVDPALPSDLAGNGLLPILMEARLPVRLEPQSDESPLVEEEIERLDMQIIVIVRPWYSQSMGLGFQRYEIQLEFDGAVRNGVREPLNDIEQIIYSATILPSLYPEVMKILEAAVLPLPSMGGREISGISLLLAEDGNHPDTLIIALGGTGDITSMPTVLGPDDDLFLVVGEALFKEQARSLEEQYPVTTRNWDAHRKETIEYLQLTLDDDAINLSGSLLVEPDMHTITPDIKVKFSGPIRLKNEITADGRPQLNFDTTGIAADAGFNDPWKRIVLDILTLGIAEVWITPGLREGEEDAETEISKSISRQLSGSLLGPFNSGLELLSTERFISRVSIVPWVIPTFGVFRKSGYMIGGLSIAGVKHRPRTVTLTHLGKAGGRTVAYGFDNTFYLDKDKAIEYYLSGRMRLNNNVFVADRRRSPHFRTKPDHTSSNNLSEMPTFNPNTTAMISANEFLCYPANGKQYWAEDGRLIDLP